MAAFRLYNTLSRAVELFEPADAKTVRMYTCGPTVYNPAHLGNFRTFLFEDLLRRVIGLRGWGVIQVMNLTDVDDKIIRRASERGITIGEVTEPVIEMFHADREFLRIRKAEHYPRATEHLPEMIDLVRRLIERDIAYQADDGSVYYAIGRFDGYGKLSRLDTREIKAGARVAQDDYTKENAQDFALWKAAKPEDEKSGAAWDSPWGRGRPGWHLECSAMAMRFLGPTLDIHCGGVDLVFPHHEDEIAQSEGATGKTFSRFWCHGEFLLTEGSKMAKRVGNVATVDDLREQGVSPAAFRHFVFSTHYRKQLSLSPEALEGSIEGVRRVGDFSDRLMRATGGTPALAEAAEEAEREAAAALFDDLNAPLAMGALFTFIRKANAELDRGGDDAAALERARSAFSRINDVLDIVPALETGGVGSVTVPSPQLSGTGAVTDVAATIDARLADRRAARQRRDFATADAIRAELEAEGIAIEDGPSGTRWKRVR
jgi:cysteinyl-tRNA synthetase